MPQKRVRWDVNLLSLAAAQQDSIAVGDIVRAYASPGVRHDTYYEGVVLEREEDRVFIHVTREVRRGKEVQVSKPEIWSPLGVSSLNRAPCVFLIAKRKVRS